MSSMINEITEHDIFALQQNIHQCLMKAGSGTMSASKFVSLVKNDLDYDLHIISDYVFGLKVADMLIKMPMFCHNFDKTRKELVFEAIPFKELGVTSYQKTTSNFSWNLSGLSLMDVYQKRLVDKCLWPKTSLNFKSFEDLQKDSLIEQSRRIKIREQWNLSDFQKEINQLYKNAHHFLSKKGDKEHAYICYVQLMDLFEIMLRKIVRYVRVGNEYNANKKKYSHRMLKYYDAYCKLRLLLESLIERYPKEGKCVLTSSNSFQLIIKKDRPTPRQGTSQRRSPDRQDAPLLENKSSESRKSLPFIQEFLPVHRKRCESILVIDYRRDRQKIFSLEAAEELGITFAMVPEHLIHECNGKFLDFLQKLPICSFTAFLRLPDYDHIYLLGDYRDPFCETMRSQTYWQNLEVDQKDDQYMLNYTNEPTPRSHVYQDHVKSLPINGENEILIRDRETTRKMYELITHHNDILHVPASCLHILGKSLQTAKLQTINFFKAQDYQVYFEQEKVERQLAYFPKFLKMKEEIEFFLRYESLKFALYDSDYTLVEKILSKHEKEFEQNNDSREIDLLVELIDGTKVERKDDKKKKKKNKSKSSKYIGMFGQKMNLEMVSSDRENDENSKEMKKGSTTQSMTKKEIKNFPVKKKNKDEAPKSWNMKTSTKKASKLIENTRILKERSNNPLSKVPNKEVNHTNKLSENHIESHISMNEETETQRWTEIQKSSSKMLRRRQEDENPPRDEHLPESPLRFSGS